MVPWTPCQIPIYGNQFQTTLTRNETGGIFAFPLLTLISEYPSRPRWRHFFLVAFVSSFDFSEGSPLYLIQVTDPTSLA
jgi:hypothetical protein